MKILFINQYFPPDTSATARLIHREATALRAAGHEVTVLCGRPSYNPIERHRWLPVTRSSVDEIRIVRVGSTAFPRGSRAGRVLNYTTFVAFAFLGALAVRSDLVVVGSDPPFAVVPAALAKRGRPLLYRLRDLHPEFSVGAGLMRTGPLVNTWEAIHRLAIRSCDAVVCVGHAMRDAVMAKGVDADKVVVLHDGADAAVSNDLDPLVIDKIRGGDSFVAVHAGNLGYGVDWQALNEASKLLPEGHSLVFVGEGAEADKLRVAGGRVLPFFPPEALASVMAAGDVQVVGQRRGVQMGAAASKVFSVMAHGRPVLVAATRDSEPAIVVQGASAGVIAEPDDPGDIAAKLLSMATDGTSLAAMGTNARASFIANYDDAAINRRFVAIVEKLLPRP